MMDPLQARYRNLPSPAAIATMTPDEIGRAVFAALADQLKINTHGFVPRDFARGAAESMASGSVEYGELILEGIGFLDRAGMFVDNPEQVGAHFFRLSRAGKAAAARDEPQIAAVAGQEARTLLHPRIAEAALGHLERGGKFLDDAAFAAFREFEVVVSERSGLNQSAKELLKRAFADNPRGPLSSSEMDAGEASSLRELMTGAYGFFRNPPAHRRVHDDAAQTMRILLVASTLFYVVEDLTK